MCRRKEAVLACGGREGFYPSRYLVGFHTASRTSTGDGCLFLLEPRRLRLKAQQKNKTKNTQGFRFQAISSQQWLGLGFVEDATRNDESFTMTAMSAAAEAAASAFPPMEEWDHLKKIETKMLGSCLKFGIGRCDVSDEVLFGFLILEEAKLLPQHETLRVRPLTASCHASCLDLQ